MERQLARRVDYNSRFPMFISLDWISDFVDISDIDPKVVADRLTMATAEVEGISTITRYVDGVIVGEITSATPFTTPEGKTRTYCDVNCGARVYKTVCGATNARVGLKAPFAPAGVTLGDKKIEASEVYGYASEGILCSAAELGMSSWHEIVFECPDSTPVGAPFAEFHATVKHSFERAISARTASADADEAGRANIASPMASARRIRTIRTSSPRPPVVSAPFSSFQSLEAFITPHIVP